MKLAHLALPLCLLSTACEAQMPSDPKVEMATAAPSMPVTFNAKDGVKLFGNYYAAPNPKAIILLFHQAGSNKAEYATIAPRLVAAGYSDQVARILVHGIKPWIRQNAVATFWPQRLIWKQPSSGRQIRSYPW
jgi:hypothetical protein